MQIELCISKQKSNASEWGKPRRLDLENSFSNGFLSLLLYFNNLEKAKETSDFLIPYFLS